MDAQNNSGATDVSKIELTPEGHLELLRKVAQFKIEERDMALDRYRRADAEIQTQEQLFTLGKTAVSFLHAASNASNVLHDMAKEMGKIVHQTDQPTVINNNFGDDKKRAVAEEVQAILRSRRKKAKDGDDSNTEE